MMMLHPPTKSKILFSSLALGLVASVTASESMPYVRTRDLPGVANPDAALWVSMNKDVQFLPVDDLPKKRSSKRARSLQDNESGDQEEGGGEEYYEEVEAGETGEWEGYDPYSVQPFVEGMGEYDEYQQAWRLLGFMIDCNYVSSGEQDEHGGSGSADTTDEGCARYVLWAAYVDLEYEGGGIGEYQYYNETTSSWDDTACSYAENGDSRCAKMDCHEDDTHFSLLGFFKHRSYDDWLEQLFKHEGMCVWSDEEYSFMKDARDAWPRGCTATGSTTEDGDAIYYDLKPMPHGRIAVGLYLDTQCIVDYSSETEVVEEVLGNYFADNGSGDNNGDDQYSSSSDTLQQSLNRWNSAFDVWRTCHPCVAHDLRNTGGNMYTSNYYYDDYYGRKLGGEYSAEGDVFECYDDAGYTNVNQCMKFSAKTTMETATFRDLTLGRSQNSLADSPLAGYLSSAGHYRKVFFGNFLTYAFLIFSTVGLCYSCAYLYRAKEETNYDLQGAVRDSLLTEKGTSA